MKKHTVRSDLKSRWLYALAAVLCFGCASAMDEIDLDGLWQFRLEAGRSLEEAGRPDFTANDRMPVPGCWDATSFYRNKRGTGLYRRTFDLDSDVKEGFLVVEGFCLRARFWIDGREIGTSALPWSTVEFRTGPLSAGRHEIVAALDSKTDPDKVKLFHDYYDFYAPGGFQHGISLVLQRRPVEIRRVVARTRDYRTGEVELEVEFAGGAGPSDFEAKVSFNGAASRPAAFKGRRARFKVPGFRLWSDKEPNMTTVRVEAAGSASETRFGIRQVGTSKGRITLNGKPVYVLGVNRHEGHVSFGASTPLQIMYEDVRNAKAMGCNFIRGAHYSQSDAFLTLCDELGILVWEESLGWQNNEKHFKDPEFVRLLEEQTRLMVRRSINHPCVIISAFLNECHSQTEPCRVAIENLIKTIRAEDSGHLVTFATSRPSNDICCDNVDVISYNAYPGWYTHRQKEDSVEDLRAAVAKCHRDIVDIFRNRYKGDERPIIIGETGVKADWGMRDRYGRAQYTEDHQAQYSRIMLEEIFAIPDIAGVAIWQFTDAKTFTRIGNVVARSYGVNTGGLFDLYRRPKLAVDVVTECYKAKALADPARSAASVD